MTLLPSIGAPNPLHGLHLPILRHLGKDQFTGKSSPTGRLSDGTWNYSYDEEGNETAKVNIDTGVTWTYGYNNRNEMTEAKEWTANPAHYGTAYVDLEETFEYDVYGNRIEQDLYPTGPATSSPVVTKFAVDGWDPAKGTPVGNENFDVWADLDGNGALQTRYLRGDAVDQILARIDNNGSALSPYWELTDRLGSVRDVIDNTGAVKDAITYDTFGNITSETNPIDRGRYAWTGREFDVETDLQYNRARYYDPSTGRWISQDPLGFNAGDSNLYRYCANSAARGADPSGEQDFGRPGGRMVEFGGIPVMTKIRFKQMMGKEFYDLNYPPVFTRPENSLMSYKNLWQAYLGVGSATSQLLLPGKFPEGDMKRPPPFYSGKQIAPLFWMKAMPSTLPGGGNLGLGGPSPQLALPGGGAIAVPGALAPAVPVPGIVMPGLGGGQLNVDAPQRGVGGRGWRGDQNWRNAVRDVERGGTIERIGGETPTVPEALDLIQEAGGTVNRIEGAHPPPNPHQYPHINYTTPNGGRGTIRTQ